LGVVRAARMIEHSAGSIVRSTWGHLPARFPGVKTDAFVVMPDHIHGIIVLNGGPTLGQVVGAFKSMSARAINRELERQGPVWQRGYYEHIVRDRDDLNRIRRYINTNPAFRR
jgi:putative transposase